MILIEFKLHNGKVPYFVKDYMSYKVEGKENIETGRRNRYLGIARKDDINNGEYLPDTVIRLKEEDFKKCLKSACIEEEKEDFSDMNEAGELDNIEKEKIAEKFILRYKI